MATLVNYNIVKSCCFLKMLIVGMEYFYELLNHAVDVLINKNRWKVNYSIRDLMVSFELSEN